MMKKKNEIPEWLFPAIIVGVVILIFLFSTTDSFNTNTEEYTYRDDRVYENNVVSDVRETNTATYCYNGECYTTQTEYNSVVENYENSQAYEKADNLWEQHKDILSNDVDKITGIFNDYCEGIDMTGVPTCVNLAYPRLEAYAKHIVNAQNFMQNNGEVYFNQQELFGYLDEHAVYVQSSANILDSMTNQYNSWALSQQQAQIQAQQEAEALSNIVKILAMAI